MLPARPTLLRHAVSVALRAVGPFTLGLALAQSGCFFSDEGYSPPTKQFYFPTGLAVSPGRTALYVANSDFDLQYNGGTIQVLDLASIRVTLAPILAGLRAGIGAPATCAQVGLQPATNQILTPSACTPISAPIKDAAIVGAFTSGLLMTFNPDKVKGGARLFAPVRGDPSITWFDITDDRKPGVANPFQLECGQCHDEAAPCTTDDECCSKHCGVSACERGAAPSQDAQRCVDEHRMGVDPYDNFRDATLPVEPVGLDADDDGEALVSAHQLVNNFAVGLAVNPWPDDVHREPRPSFEFSLATNVASGPTEVAHIPKPRLVKDAPANTIAYQPGFLVTYNETPEVDIFRYDSDSQASPQRPFLTRASQSAISVNADGKDSRGIAVDPSRRQTCEDGCYGVGPGVMDVCHGKPDPKSCLRCCVDTPLDVFIANRTPATLVLGHVLTTVADTGLGVSTGAFDVAVINDVVPLSTGPSKVAVGKVIGIDGQLHTRVFAVTFDSRFVFEYDPVAGRVDQIIRTGRGPHPIAFDACVTCATPGAPGCCAEGEEQHAFMFVGHFTDSYLGVVDLDMTQETFGTMFASIGTPIEPRESK